MRFHISRNITVKIILIAVLILLIVMLYSNWKIIMDVIYPFLISIFLAYLLNPLVCRMEQKGIKRSVGILLIYLLFFGIIFLIIYYMIPMLVKDIGNLTGNLPKYTEKIKNIIQYVQDRYSKIELPLGIRNVIDNNITKLQNSITLYFESLAATLILFLSKALSIALIPILLYYFLKDFKSITSGVALIIPRKYRMQVTRICTNIDDIFGNYVRSQIILSLIIAVLTSLALFILKINYALIIGIINGITNIIPYFGPLIGGIPAVLIAFLQSPIKALYTIIALIIIQQLESDVIAPKITGDIVGLHPLTVILAMIIGGELFGITGLVLGVPAAAALKVVYQDVMKSLF